MDLLSQLHQLRDDLASLEVGQTASSQVFAVSKLC